jgi:hypothetical protein
VSRLLERGMQQGRRIATAAERNGNPAFGHGFRLSPWAQRSLVSVKRPYDCSRS